MVRVRARSMTCKCWAMPMRSAHLIQCEFGGGGTYIAGHQRMDAARHVVSIKSGHKEFVVSDRLYVLVCAQPNASAQRTLCVCMCTSCSVRLEMVVRNRLACFDKDTYIMAMPACCLHRKLQCTCTFVQHCTYSSSRLVWNSGDCAFEYSWGASCRIH